MSPVKRAKAGAGDEAEAHDLTGLTMGTQFDAKGDPPAYNISLQNTHLSTTTSIRSVSSFGKPTNFLYIVEDGVSDIKETYVIDPSLHIPEAYLLPRNFANGDCVSGERKNVYLHTNSGNIDVDLWIVGRKDSKIAPSRTTVHLSSRCGSIAVKINAIDSIHPFTLKVAAEHGPVTVLIPRSFHGTVTRSRNCDISEEVVKHSTHLGAAINMVRLFVGDFSVVSGSGFGSELTKWEPDELRADMGRGFGTIKYVDEVESVASRQDKVESVVSKENKVRSK